MNLTIVHIGGTTKTVELEDMTPTGGWIQVRYPNGGGCYNFHLSHGQIETKRSDPPLWHMDDADLEKCREIARERKIRWRARRGGATQAAQGEGAEQANRDV